MQLLMQQIRQTLHHGCLGTLLRAVLVNGVVADKLTRAFTRDPRMVGDARVAHGIVAGNLNNVCAVGVEVVADVFGKGLLLVRPLVCPLLAFRVPIAGGAFFPSLEHVKGVGQRLGDYDARVESEFAAAVFGSVLVAIENLARVERHGNARVGCDAPAVEQPFDGEFKVLDRGVGVDEDDKLVRLEKRVQHVWFYPCVVHTLHVGGVDEAVVVAVDLRCEAVGIVATSEAWGDIP